MEHLRAWLGQSKPLTLTIVAALVLMAHWTMGYFETTGIAIANLIASERTPEQVEGLWKIITSAGPILGFFTVVATGLISALSKSMDPPDDTRAQLIDAINRTVDKFTPDGPPPPAPKPSPAPPNPNPPLSG